MQAEKINLFLQQFSEGSHTEELHQQFLDWLKTAPAEEVEAFASQYQTILEQKQITAAAPAELVTHIEAALNQYELAENNSRQPTARVISLLALGKIAAAAAILFLVAGSAWYFFIRNPKPDNTIARIQPVNDILPGSDKAILTLADGQQVILTDAQNGQIAKQGSVAINKKDGEVIYLATNVNKEETVQYNTITTPRTGKYFLKLSDGTSVWLDAASSITYPTYFNGKERNVQLTGQGYFEVATSPQPLSKGEGLKRPFIVSTATQDVTVLGTHFNIMAYEDEAVIKTTLLEGSVRVKSEVRSQKSEVLKPGQQAQLNKEGQLKLIVNADTEQAVAWKNGLFKLGGTPIQEIMRQVSRWYDVDIEYKGNFDKVIFSGVVSRRQNVSQLLKIMEATGDARFVLEGKKIIVTRN